MNALANIKGTKIAFRAQMEKATNACPVCNSPAFIRDSDEMTPLVKDLWIHCGNTDCGMTWKAQIAFIHVISPSALEHDLDLPQPPPGYRRTIFSKDAAPDPNQINLFEDTG